MNDPLVQLANLVLGCQEELSSEAKDAVFCALHELHERRHWPEYHAATPGIVTGVDYRAKVTDTKLKKLAMSPACLKTEPSEVPGIFAGERDDE